MTLAGLRYKAKCQRQYQHYEWAQEGGDQGGQPGGRVETKIQTIPVGPLVPSFAVQVPLLLLP